MSLVAFYKLLAIFATVGAGWLAGRRRWIGGGSVGGDVVARVLSDAAFYLFVPALLFRTVVRLEFETLPWRTLAAFYAPAIAFVAAVYLWQRRLAAAGPTRAPAMAATATMAVVYGNTVQLGIPLAAALFGETGLALHIALVSVHGLLMLTLMTVLVEVDIARADATATVARTVATTVRNALVHPVTLPVIAGIVWHFTGLGLHPVVDEMLAGLGVAVVPVCLVLIGVTLELYGVRGQWRTALAPTLLKLVAMPALVLAVAWFGFGLRGLPLSVLVTIAALPLGSNALIFAQRYGVLQAQATTVIVFSTLVFAVTGSAWLAVLTLLQRAAP